MPLACKLCIMTKGLKGRDIDLLPKTEDDLIEHIESDHHIPVRRAGETGEQAKERLYAKFPEAKDPATCKCPACVVQRRLRAIVSDGPTTERPPP